MRATSRSTLSYSGLLCSGLADRAILLTLVAALSVAATVVPTIASAEGDASRAVPAVPELNLRFEDGGEAAPCAALPVTPSETAVECWSAYVDRAVSKRSSPLTDESELACIEVWEVVLPGERGCPADAARCVRPQTELFEKVAPGIPVDTNISATWALTSELAREYTAFQVLRNGHALNPLRPRIAGLALSQGMLVLYRAHAIRDLQDQLESAGCATEHLDPYFAQASRVTDEVGRSDVPAILESFPPLGREWSRRFRRVQLEVIGRGEGVRASGKWREDCEKAASIGPDVGRLDADVNVWCGYAYEQLDMPEAALEHWRLARRSPHHPEAASYANGRLKIAPAEPGETTAEVR
jgi:hypothetical protein